MIKGYYKFKGDATDSSGNGINGTNYGSPTYNNTGPTGYSITYGSGKYTDLGGTNFNYGKDSNFTLSFWGQTTGTTNQTALSSEGPNPFKGIFVGLQNTTHGLYGNFIYAFNSARYDFYSSTARNDGVWHLFEIVYPAGTTNAELRVDGVTRAKTVSTNTLGTNEFASAVSMYIGARHYDQAQYWEGSISDVIIRDTAISKAESKNNYMKYKGFF